MAPRFEFVEFFVGAGLVRAGLGPHWSCRLAVDDDPAKRSAYGLNFPLADFVCADVAKLTLADLPPGMLWKSPPCISLSSAGRRDGMVPSVRGSGAIWAALRLTAALAKDGRAPRLVVIENVVEILKDKDWPAVVEALAGCGYRVGAAVIDARRFVPQSRERAFVIAAAADVEIPLDLIADCPTAWHAPAPVGAAHAVLPAELRRSWAWWRLPEPPQRTSLLSDVIEDRPTGVAWDSETETRRLIAMMTPLHKEKVEAAKRAGRRMVGGLFKRIRKENGKKVQRAELRFDDVAGALRVPTGASSKQTVMIVDGDQHERLMGDPVCIGINETVEKAATAVQRDERGYLGASSAGSECLRRIQFDWLCPQAVDAVKARIFARGHAFEAAMREQLRQAGFAFASDDQLAFVALEYLQGHADGLIVNAPTLVGGIKLRLPCLWECKCLKRDYWSCLARDGLAKTFPQYATQVALYQHFLGRKNPALFTAGCADDCRALHFLVPYDEERADNAIANIERVIAATKASELLMRGYRSPEKW